MTLEHIELPHAWQGQGQPLVLIAGLGGKATSWRPFLDAATQRYRVLTFDNPGAGAAPALPGRVTIRELARTVLALLDRLGVERAHLIGRSMGGMIAQQLTLLPPERAEHDALERLQALSVPALIVTGSDDRLTPLAHAEALAKVLPMAQLACLPGAGHLPYLECPELFARTVLEFLQARAPHE